MTRRTQEKDTELPSTDPMTIVSGEGYYLLPRIESHKVDRIQSSTSTCSSSEHEGVYIGDIMTRKDQ